MGVKVVKSTDAILEKISKLFSKDFCLLYIIWLCICLVTIFNLVSCSDVHR